MPTRIKERVRARREKTGESYERALRHVRAEETRAPTPNVERPPPVVADTAFSIAVVRADEASLRAEERLFHDPYASIFAAAGAEVAESTQRFLDLPFFRDGVRLRTRYIDDAVRAGLAAGLEQVVILGAGFDMRALRLAEIAERRVSVYEVDHAEQGIRKRRLLAAARVSFPATTKAIPVSLDVASLDSGLATALEGKGFRRGEGAIFVWEGVIGYIADDVIDATMRFAAREGGSGSRLVLTYAEGSFGDETAAERTRRAGFGACEELAGDALWRRYLRGEPHPNAPYMKVGTATL